MPDGASSRPTVTLRNAIASDLPGVRALLEQAGLPLDGVEDQFDRGYVIAITGNRIVGAAGVEVHGEHGLLRSAVVHPDMRGRGIGARLTQERIEWARQQGLKSLWLLTTTAADFFPRFGFEAARRDDAPPAIRSSGEFAYACPGSAVCQRLLLT